MKENYLLSGSLFGGFALSFHLFDERFLLQFDLLEQFVALDRVFRNLILRLQLLQLAQMNLRHLMTSFDLSKQFILFVVGVIVVIIVV